MDTSQVTDMSQMFLNCRSLKNLDLKSFQTNQVNDMSQMFGGCSDLRVLNITNFDTSRVTNMNGMFSGCETLEKLDLSNFDTTNVKHMTNMFENSDALKSLNLGDKFIVPKDKEEDLKLVDKVWVNIGNGTEDNPKPDDKNGVTSVELLSMANKGNWVAKPEKEYQGPFTVKIPNNIDDELTVEIPTAVQPEYVGSTFEIDVPQKNGYVADKKTVAIIAMVDKLMTEDKVTYTALEKTPVKNQRKVEPTHYQSVQPLSAVQSAIKAAPVVETEVVKPAVKGTVTDFMNYVTVYPDLESAQVYDINGLKAQGRILDKNYSWFSDKALKIGDQKYYHVLNHDWIKAEDVYIYREIDKTVRTKDVLMTTLVDSRTKASDVRALGSLMILKSKKLALLNNHKYYQITANEFVDVDKVDVIDA